MPLPPEIVPVTVEGTLLRSDPGGTPDEGYIVFHQRNLLRDSADNVILTPAKYKVVLNPAGSFSVEVPSTNSPGISPQDFAYEIEVNTKGWKQTFDAQIPGDQGNPFPFADIVEVASASGDMFALIGHSHSTMLGTITFTGRQILKPDNLVDAPLILTNAALGNHFRVTLGGNRTLDAPTNPIDGQRVIWEVTQDAVGGRTLTLNAIFKFGTSIASYAASAAPLAKDYIGAIYHSGQNKWHVIAVAKGYLP